MTQLNDYFYGRAPALELLKKRILDLKEGYRQNIALLGTPHIGKTSILHKLLLNLDDSDLISIYLDLENKEFSYFVSKFTASLLYNYSKSQHLPLHEDLDLLIESTRKTIPNTIAVIQKIQANLKNGRYTDCFLGLLVLPEVFTNETNKFCILILDEFQNLEDFPLNNVFRELGKKIMTQKRCLYIVSSSYPKRAKKILSEKLSLLFGNFETVAVESFDQLTSQKFLEGFLKDVKMGAQLRNFTIDFTGGHPLYLHLIGHELLNLSAIHKQNEIYLPLLTLAIENTLFNRWGVISRHFELVINDLSQGKGAKMVAPLLMTLANGQNKIEEITKELNLKRSPVSQKLNWLMEAGVVIRNGNFYCFKDKLFKYWIKFVYQKRLKEVDLTLDKQSKQFKDEFHKAFEAFRIISRKDLSSRVIELLHCFDNEAFDLNGRKYKLPSFREILSQASQGDSSTGLEIIKATTEQAHWYIAIKKDALAENDVNQISIETKKGENKPQRCLIVSLAELDQNARLRAFQERFWVWGESELNSLLTLFDQPLIVR